jgi:hypothetical protein
MFLGLTKAITDTTQFVCVIVSYTSVFDYPTPVESIRQRAPLYSTSLSKPLRYGGVGTSCLVSGIAL